MQLRWRLEAAADLGVLPRHVLLPVRQHLRLDRKGARAAAGQWIARSQGKGHGLPDTSAWLVLFCGGQLWLASWFQCLNSPSCSGLPYLSGILNARQVQQCSGAAASASCGGDKPRCRRPTKGKRTPWCCAPPRSAAAAGPLMPVARQPGMPCRPGKEPQSIALYPPPFGPLAGPINTVTALGPFMIDCTSCKQWERRCQSRQPSGGSAAARLQAMRSQAIGHFIVLGVDVRNSSDRASGRWDRQLAERCSALPS